MRILVADDHFLIRDAVRGILRELQPDATVVEASHFAEAVRLIGENPDFELVLLDLNMPGGDGLDTLAQLRERHPAAPIVVVSALQDRDTVLKALDLGALGFIPKSGRRDVMLGALRLVVSGGIYIPPEVLERTCGADASQSRAKPTPADAGLTERQLDVLALLMEGKSNKAICRVLDLAEPTVKNHVTAILKALKARNRTEAVIAVAALGWKLPKVPVR